MDSSLLLTVIAFLNYCTLNNEPLSLSLCWYARYRELNDLHDFWLMNRHFSLFYSKNNAIIGNYIRFLRTWWPVNIKIEWCWARSQNWISLGYVMYVYFYRLNGGTTSTNTSLTNVCYMYFVSYVCRFYFEFIACQAPQIAREIRDEYIDTMAKVYLSYFKAYATKLMKLQVC